MAREERLRELAEVEEPRAALLQAQLRPGQEGVTEVLLIRHAQTPASSDPGEDSALTDIGREQADALGAFLALRPLYAVYSSPTLRTRGTADAVAKPHGLAVVTIDDLREVEVYPPKGKTWDEFRNEDVYKERAERFREERRWDVYAPFMERSHALRERILNTVDQVVASNPGRRIAVVTHGPVINAYVAGLTGSPRDMVVRTSLTGVTVVLAKDDRRLLHTVNSTVHFGTL
jgi:probable phosphoglycerate mutase